MVIVISLFATYLMVGDRCSNATTESMLGLFAVQQAFILSRIWMKLSFHSSQLACYQAEEARTTRTSKTPPRSQASVIHARRRACGT